MVTMTLDEYPHLKMFLKEKGYLIEDASAIPDRDTTSYLSTPFSVEIITGLLMHSTLSSYPRSNFFTDGQNVYYPRDEEIDEIIPLPQTQEDLIRESQLFSLLHYQLPDDYLSVFAKADGHVRLARFEPAFNGYNLSVSTKPGGKVLEKITALDTFSDLIINDERYQIARRVRRHASYLQHLLLALSQDPQPLPQYARMLKQSLSEYGFSPEAKQERSVAGLL